MPALLKVGDLRTSFHGPDGVTRAVDGVSFEIGEGETVAIVGESGSGKSVTALSIMRLLPEPPAKVVARAIIFGDTDLMSLNAEAMRAVRGRRIAMVFQDPMTSLNPALTIDRQLGEAMRRHLGFSRAQASRRSVELLRQVGIADPTSRLRDYPHQLSGGMRQRVMIGIALSCEPRLVIADEPTTALDVTIQAQILSLMRRLIVDQGTAFLLITHNLGVVAGFAQRVLVMYAGRIVEEASTTALFKRPRHPYTIALLRSLPRLDRARAAKLEHIEGFPPNPLQLPPGCAFAPRCSFVQEQCTRERPELRDVGSGQRAACWVDVESVQD